MTNIVLVVFVEGIVVNELERFPPKDNGLLDRESDPLQSGRSTGVTEERTKCREAYFEKQVVLLPTFVLEMLAAAQRVLERAHAHGKALPREIWHHLGGDLLAIARGREDILGGDACLEAHGEVLEDGKETLILVESWKGFRGHLER